MTLQYPSKWKFDGIGFGISAEANSAFFRLVQKMASGVPNPQEVYEGFKAAFGCQSWSSSASWAESDLATAMSGATDNAAQYVSSFWEGIEAADRSGVGCPSVEYVNRLLDEHGIRLVVDPPALRLKVGDVFVSDTPLRADADGFLTIPF